MKKITIDTRSPGEQMLDKLIHAALVIGLGVVAVFLTGCGTTDKVSTFREAVGEQDNDLKSGVYQNRKGQNVYVSSKNLDARIKELETENGQMNLMNHNYQYEIQQLKKEKAKLLLENSLLKMKLKAKNDDQRLPASMPDEKTEASVPNHPKLKSSKGPEMSNKIDLNKIEYYEDN